MSRMMRRKTCHFCENKVTIDYKDEHLLDRFTNDRGKILPRRVTGVCARHQRQLSVAVKRGRYLALIAYLPDHAL
ncbi:MAG TPA: 30S ribosomal protein S18 [Gemmatimonadota bacterium]|nr:30S ribosomal protein S18 [Gemmatimonadota bacterium]